MATKPLPRRRPRRTPATRTPKEKAAPDLDAVLKAMIQQAECSRLRGWLSRLLTSPKEAK
jgi:hypothetical protein